MEHSDQYNFSIFKPRNLHGRKNRNVIFTMVIIWTVAVFGFQILLRITEKPTPEKTLAMFESAWPATLSGNLSQVDINTLLHSLALVKGKNMVKPEDQKILSDAISTLFYMSVPDSLQKQIISEAASLKALKKSLAVLNNQEYLDANAAIGEKTRLLSKAAIAYTGIREGSLEAVIVVSSLEETNHESLADSAFSGLPDIMKLYLTHNQSKLTDTKFLGFPFHYFYTAVFLLILFIALCIIYNILIEWRLNKEGIVE